MVKTAMYTTAIQNCSAGESGEHRGRESLHFVYFVRKLGFVGRDRTIPGADVRHEHRQKFPRGRKVPVQKIKVFGDAK